MCVCVCVCVFVCVYLQESKESGPRSPFGCQATQHKWFQSNTTVLRGFQLPLILEPMAQATVDPTTGKGNNPCRPRVDVLCHKGLGWTHLSPFARDLFVSRLYHYHFLFLNFPSIFVFHSEVCICAIASSKVGNSPIKS